jgi:hypothetical protein
MKPVLLASVFVAAGFLGAARPAQAQTQAPTPPADCAVWSRAENRCLQKAPTAAEIAACTVWSHAEQRCLNPESPAAAIARITEAAHASRDAMLERIRQDRARATPIAPQLEQPPVTVGSQCAKEWPTDFRMQAYCQTQQGEALKKLTTRHDSGVLQTPAGTTIRTTCAREWPNDPRMRNYCEEQQLKALATLR